MVLIVGVVVIWLFSIVDYVLGSGSVNVNNEWNSRNIEAYFSRLGSRVDQLVLRFDHLDSRINRFTSLLQGRLDGVENSLSTTKLKMDLWGEELSRIDEQLTRKWKNMESKLELLVPSIDSKLENKLTLIQRDNRRHNEHLSSLILGISQRFDTKAETIIAAVGTQQNGSSNGCVQKQMTKDSQPNRTPNRNSDDEKLENIYKLFSNKTDEILKSNTAISLIGTKVTNMFEDLIQRTDSIQTEVKTSINISNSTKQEVHENMRVLSQSSRLRHSFGSNSMGSSMTSSETMSAVIVEALASVESMSTALGRRMAELSRSIEGRFEMVSMTLNGFLESCIRIQEGAPLIEEHIAAVLEKILDGFDNTTRGAQEDMYGVSRKLDLLLNSSTKTATCIPGGGGGQSLEDLISQPGVDLTSQHQSSVVTSTVSGVTEQGQSQYQFRAAEILQNSQDLTEDEKKLLWESLFPNHEVPD